MLLKSETSPRALLYNCTKRLGACTGGVHLHAMPDHSYEIARWVARLDCGLIYRGEGLPNIALKWLHRLVKQGREREWLTGEQKAELVEQFDHKCALCGARSSTLEFDHIARHSEGYGEQEFQPLCSACHRVKTDTEAKTHDEDHLASHFEKSVYEQYVDSPRPPPLVHRVRALTSLVGLEIADVRRCRKNALEYNVHALPVFSALSTASCCGLLRRWATTISVRKKYRNCVRQRGYCGPGWQHRVQPEFLLHMGQLTWEDISHTGTATAHLPAGLLTKQLRQMEAAWEGSHLAKLAVNSLIGLWAIDQAFSHALCSSTCETDAPVGSQTDLTLRGGEHIRLHHLHPPLGQQQLSSAPRPLYVHRGGKNGPDVLRAQAEPGGDLRDEDGQCSL